MKQKYHSTLINPLGEGDDDPNVTAKE